MEKIYEKKKLKIENNQEKQLKYLDLEERIFSLIKTKKHHVLKANSAFRNSKRERK